MKMHVPLIAPAAFLAVGAFLLTLSGQAAEESDRAWKPILDEPAAQELIARSIKAIQNELGTSKGNAKAIRKSYKKIQVAAVELSAFAQSAEAGANKQKLATYRNTALHLAQAAAAGNIAEIKKQADALADLKTDPEAKPAPVSLKKYLDDAGEAMQPLRAFALGGDGIHPDLQSSGPLKNKNGIEEKLLALGRRAVKPAQLGKESEELTLLAKKIAVLAQVAREWAPSKKEGDKDPENWREWSVEMRDAALKLASAATMKDPKAVLAATKGLNSSCTKCHGVFKTHD